MIRFDLCEFVAIKSNNINNGERCGKITLWKTRRGAKDKSYRGCTS